MIGVVDYGTGNIGSLGNALATLNLPFVHSADREKLAACDWLLLPGVGAFGPARESLADTGLIPFVSEWVAADKRLLGICLGMQLLFTWSEERGRHQGLDLIPGQVVKIKGAPRTVHMGWNEVTAADGINSLVPAPGYAYFVHSFHCVPDDPAAVVAWTDYGGPVAAVVHQGSTVGVQFHPEKSQRFGLDLLLRFNDGDI